MWNGVRLPVSPRSLSRAGGIRHAARVQLPNYSIYLKLMIDRFTVATIQCEDTEYK
jgi:hypothetical protein